MNAKFIDINQLLKNKTPFWHFILPGLLINKIKKLVHEDEINATIESLKDLNGLEFNRAVLNRLKIQMQVNFIEHISKTGPLTIVSNHPLGGVDGMALLEAVSKQRSDVQVLTNDLLCQIKGFGSVFIPVNSFGKSSLQHIRQMEAAFKESGVVIIFPAGMVSRSFPEGIVDLPWKKSCITQSVKYQRQILPVYIEGSNSPRFYKLARWRKRLKIPINLEMFLLPDEMFRSAQRNVKMYFGNPVSYQTWTKDYTPEFWAQRLHEYVYSKEIKAGLSFEQYLHEINRKDSN